MSKLDELVDGYLSHLFEEFPVIASQLGIDGYDERTGDYSAEAVARREQQADDWMNRFESIEPSEMTVEEQIDRDLVTSNIRGAQITRDWQAHKRDPGVYLGPGLQGIFTLFLNRIRPEPELAVAAEARLRAVPNTIAQGKANIDPTLASKLIVDRSKGQCQAGIHYFRNLVPAEIKDETARQRVEEAGELAAVAFEDFAKFLDDVSASASGEWALGEKRYSGLLIEKEKLGYGTEEMLERGKEAYAALSKEMSDFAKEWRGTDDWLSVVRETNKDHPTTPEQMREEYDDWTEKARQFLKDKDLVSFPEGETCLVVPSPHFQRPILAVASYSPPPAFKPGVTGHFFVPYPPEGTSEEELQKRLESNSRGSIPTTSVHEAYPGHHWHLVTMKQARKIRRVLWTSYFVEGWGLYAEKMMREQGFFTDPAHELGHLDARIFRAARIVVDTSLHMGKMTFEEGVDFMSNKTSLTEPTARAEVGRYCSWPTQAPSYLTGSIEIERMRERWFTEKKGDLKQFHDKIAGSGGLPIGLAERALMT